MLKYMLCLSINIYEVFTMLMKKYFAFMLMLFAVTSNASDRCVNFAVEISENSKIVLISRLNEIISTNLNRASISIERQAYGKNSFKSLTEILKASEGLYFYILLSGLLVFCAFFINNAMHKNNIWKLAVF